MLVASKFSGVEHINGDGGPSTGAPEAWLADRHGKGRMVSGGPVPSGLR